VLSRRAGIPPPTRQSSPVVFIPSPFTGEQHATLRAGAPDQGLQSFSPPRALCTIGIPPHLVHMEGDASRGWGPTLLRGSGPLLLPVGEGSLRVEGELLAGQSHLSVLEIVNEIVLESTVHQRGVMHEAFTLGAAFRREGGIRGSNENVRRASSLPALATRDCPPKQIGVPAAAHRAPYQERRGRARRRGYRGSLVSENTPSMKIGSPPGGACQY
jgi:hypothetical protein